jgi:hypothetical protein
MEMEANELFDSYRELYFEGGTSSVYLWDLENGFAGCFLIKKRRTASHFEALLTPCRHRGESLREQRQLGQHPCHRGYRNLSHQGDL